MDYSPGSLGQNPGNIISKTTAGDMNQAADLEILGQVQNWFAIDASGFYEFFTKCAAELVNVIIDRKA